MADDYDDDLAKIINFTQEARNFVSELSSKFVLADAEAERQKAKAESLDAEVALLKPLAAKYAVCESLYENLRDSCQRFNAAFKSESADCFDIKVDSLVDVLKTLSAKLAHAVSLYFAAITYINDKEAVLVKAEKRVGQLGYELEAFKNAALTVIAGATKRPYVDDAFETAAYKVIESGKRIEIPDGFCEAMEGTFVSLDKKLADFDVERQGLLAESKRSKKCFKNLIEKVNDIREYFSSEAQKLHDKLERYK